MTPGPGFKRRLNDRAVTPVHGYRAILMFSIGLVALLLLPLKSQAQRSGGSESLPTIESHTEGMTLIDGFFPLYYQAEHDRLFMEVAQFDTEVLHMTGLAAGLGSNDIGLDRGGGSGSRVVTFEKHGRRVMMVQPNLGFRAYTDNEA